jgi:RalA-binding protein 1
MTVRNVGIVFSPTLGIPAGVFSLMLSEYPRVFGIDEAGDQGDNTGDDGNRLTARVESVSEQEAFSRTRRSRRNSGPDTARPDNRNSVSYNEGSVDRLLGLQGRILASKSHISLSLISC